MDNRLNPAAAQFVVDSHASVMRQIDPHATIPSGEDAENSSQITPSSKAPIPKTQPSSTTRFKQKKVPTLSPNLGSQPSRRQRILSRLSYAMTFWSIFRTWLLSLCQAISNELLVWVPLARSYPRLLKWVPNWRSTIVTIIAIPLLVMFFSALTGPIMWARGITATAIDHWAKDACYGSWLRPICSYGCGISPWFVLYLLSNTCSHHLSPKGPTVDPSWQTAIAFDEMGNIPRNIPRLIAAQESHCYYYRAVIERFPDGLPISEDSRNSLQLTQNEICSELKDTSSYLSAYHRHVKIFSERILRSIDIGGTRTEALVNPSSYSMLEQQNKLNKEMPDLMTQWQKRYDFFVSPGQLMSEEMRASRQKVVDQLKILWNLKEETLRARTDKIKSWNLLRRFGRRIGLLRSDPPELYGYNDALEVLDGWIPATMPLINLYTMIEIEVAERDSSLRNAAASKFSANVRFRLAPEGLLELFTYWKGHGSKAPDVGKLIEGARSIQREERL